MLELNVDTYEEGTCAGIVTQVDSGYPVFTVTVSDLRIHSGVLGECEEVLGCEVKTCFAYEVAAHQPCEVVADGDVGDLEVVSVLDEDVRDVAPVAVVHRGSLFEVPSPFQQLKRSRV